MKITAKIWEDVKPIGKMEMKELTKAIDKIEQEIWFIYRHLNGNFFEADIYSIDDDRIEAEIKFGYSDGGSSVTYKDSYSWDRYTKKLNEV